MLISLGLNFNQARTKSAMTHVLVLSSKVRRNERLWPCHFNKEIFDETPYFSYISRCHWPYIKACGRTTPTHEHPIIISLGCVCWSSFIECNVLISMVKGLRTPCKDEHGLALSQLGGRFLQLHRSSEIIATCYARTMLNLSLLRVSINVVLNKQLSARAMGSYQWSLWGTLWVLWRTCEIVPKHNTGRGGLLHYWVGKEWLLTKSNGLLPQRNHIGEAIQTSTRIGLITCSWPPYNTTIPYVCCAFVWHPYFPYINRQLQPYIKLNEAI